MSGSLAGRTVLVTRPAHQAEPLCRMLREQGAEPLRFPTLEIVPPRDPDAARAALAHAGTFDLLVFISANAVTQSLALAGTLPAAPRRAVIGRATARALTEAGEQVDLQPRHGADSEALLALPELRRVDGWRVLIVRGEGGREVLAGSLRARGATVEYAEVYRRSRPQADPAPLLDRWRAGGIDAATATSNETLANLHALIGPAGHEPLLATPLAVASPRALELALELGWRAPVRVAASAEDAAMVAALIELLVQSSTAYSNES
ncbi:MAG: uroporphyrinogen-III synthase [Candidatus Competibacterales bacterium]|nr:uroporphyrinogen-III synthase [Candidatus Competibacterales bacterium]